MKYIFSILLLFSLTSEVLSRNIFHVRPTHITADSNKYDEISIKPVSNISITLDLDYNYVQRSVKIKSCSKLNCLTVYFEDLSLFKGSTIGVVDLRGNELFSGTVSKEFLQINTSRWAGYFEAFVEIYNSQGDVIFRKKIYE